jgi:NAD(P)-dependent dehydrogenase (short-subunit alcohol dehydrogenase family)
MSTLKNVLITGTSSGFGKLTALTLADQGYSVIAAMRGSKDKNAAVAEELKNTPNIEVIEMDVTSSDSVNGAVEKILAKYGAIDVLVNNAGVTGSGVLEATSVDVIKALFEVNYFGLIRLYQAILPGMRKNKSGLIINISSGLGLVSLPYLIPYNSSKFALEALTEGIRTEVKRFNIENISIQCGPYPTGINLKTGFNADKRNIIDEYGSVTHDAIQRFGGKLYEKINHYQMNPQAIADGLLKLVKMPAGKRPFQLPIDAIAEGTDQILIDTRNKALASYIDNYGFEV